MLPHSISRLLIKAAVSVKGAMLNQNPAFFSTIKPHAGSFSIKILFNNVTAFEFY
jgi:hypothetical protein